MHYADWNLSKYLSLDCYHNFLNIECFAILTFGQNKTKRKIREKITDFFVDEKKHVICSKMYKHKKNCEHGWSMTILEEMNNKHYH